MTLSDRQWSTSIVSRHWFLWAAIALGCMIMLPFAAYFVAIMLAEPLLDEHTPLHPADAIVVLGGDGPSRADMAAKLWHEGMARHVVVTGDGGDCVYIRADMVKSGVPKDAFDIDCLARNTWQNAANSAPLVEAAHSAIIVTSWFHTRRALGAFRALCPGIDWMAAPTPPPSSIFAIAAGPYGPQLAKEYVKLAGYWLRDVLFPPLEPEPGMTCTIAGNRS